MMYLFEQLVFPWLLIALVLGLAIGWWSCRAEPRTYGFGWLTWGIIAFLFGLFAAAMKLVPGVAGLWLEILLWLFFAYVLGCFLGCLLGRIGQPAGEVALAGAGAAGATVSAAAPVKAAPPAPSAQPRPAGPAAVRPYQWQAAKDSGAVTLTGYVPSEAARAGIVAETRKLSAPLGVVDKLQLGGGAPGGLEALAGAAAGHLAQLDKGIASLIDSKYTLTGVAGTQAGYDGVMSAVKALPAGFTLAKADIVAPPAPRVAPVAPPAAAAPAAAMPAAAVAAKPAAPAPAPAPAPAAAPAPAPAAVANVVSDDPPPAPALADEGKVPGKRPRGFASPRGGKADDLKRIRGIGKQNEGRLHGLGIWHFDQIAAWVADEALWVGSYLAFPGRIEREDWISQAKVLASGEDTEFSKRVARGEVATSQDDGSLGKGNIEVLAPLRAVPKPPKKT
jgi:predicted flap endonuclease-1-like 5' DNA nuclease